MTWGRSGESAAIEDMNPAAKIQVLDELGILFTGWYLHALPKKQTNNDSRYFFQMTGAVPVK